MSNAAEQENERPTRPIRMTRSEAPGEPVDSVVRQRAVADPGRPPMPPAVAAFLKLTPPQRARAALPMARAVRQAVERAEGPHREALLLLSEALTDLGAERYQAK